MIKIKTADPISRSGAALTINPKLPDILLAWYDQNARSLPWRQDTAPYHVWLSEIMLQQTRVEAVKAYYTRFLAAFPTIEALAQADEGKLLKLWEGLGYYSRVRNLQKAAKLICGQYGGSFPCDYEQMIRLPGVGVYTAGAIASISFGKPVPAVDGNVLRVIARILGIHEPIDTPDMKKQITASLAEIYPTRRSGDFTQSLFELGAMVCLPNGQPKCDYCPLAGFCKALRENSAAQLPVRQAKREKRVEEITLFLLTCRGSVAIRRREGKGLLAGMWELPNVNGVLTEQQAIELASHWGAAPSNLIKSSRRVHIFTHIKWNMLCYFIACEQQPECFFWADHEALSKAYALPTAFKMFLQE